MLYNKIKEMRMQAVKTRSAALKNVLTVLLGEVDRIKDTKGTDDDIIISVVQKMVKNAEETMKICKDNNIDFTESSYLISVLNDFRPKSLSETEIRKIVEEAVISFGNRASIGLFMSEFKKHEGIDMKIASSILKEVLNG